MSTDFFLGCLLILFAAGAGLTIAAQREFKRQWRQSQARINDRQRGRPSGAPRCES